MEAMVFTAPGQPLERRELPGEDIFGFGVGYQYQATQLQRKDTHWLTTVMVSWLAFEHEPAMTMRAAIEACCAEMRNNAETIAGRLLGVLPDPTQRNR